MSKARNIPIDITRGTSKTVTVVANDEPDLTGAEIVITVKRHIVDQEICLQKPIDINASTKLTTGEFVFTFVPEDTDDLPARTYTYEVKITIDNRIYISLIGNFNIFESVT